MSTDTAITATKGRQLSVFLDDRPGTLGEVTACLGEAGVNVYALSLAEGTGHGYVRMVVDRHDLAREILQKNGYLFFERSVVLLDVPNAPGSLAAVARRWGEQGVNIEYAYCAGGPRVDRGLVIVRADDIEKALGALHGLEAPRG